MVWSDGTIRWLRETGNVLFDEASEAVKFTGIVRDVTTRKMKIDQIIQLAHFDGLTGLANREFFRDQLKEAFARADRHGTLVALVFMDLNKFKPINDTYGHTYGDQVLMAVAQNMKKSIRSIELGISIGLSLYPQDASDIDELIHIADMAMYREKKSV